jgi:hypothetical protein
MHTQTEKKPDSQPKADGFSAEWLQLRESADHRARSSALTRLLLDWTQNKDQLNIVELGTGTGSNLRYLCPQLGHNQHWLLVDVDHDLLAQLPMQLQQWATQEDIKIRSDSDAIWLETDTFDAEVRWLCKDLSHELTTIPLNNVDLLTGSALLDLTSAAWLEQLAQLCIDHHCASLFVLNYDGTIQWHHEQHDDKTLNDLLNAHQLNDKGFGTALGPQAHHYFAEQLRKAHQVTTQSSPWRLSADDSALQEALLTSWITAAIEQDPTALPLIELWTENRKTAIQQRQSSLRVGHTDVLGLPLA